MRTTEARILPGCIWCDYDHDPEIQCRLEPESSRFQPKPKPEREKTKPVIVRDAAGNIIGVRS
jgi:hypothetical protein